LHRNSREIREEDASLGVAGMILPAEHPFRQHPGWINRYDFTLLLRKITQNAQFSLPNTTKARNLFDGVQSWAIWVIWFA
jgi:hypothetical protein